MKKNGNVLNKLFLICIITVVLGLSVAKYTSEIKTSNVVTANSFYFTSDLLDENMPEYNIYNWTSSSNINFKLRNYIDEERVSNTNINYEISATQMENVTGVLEYNNKSKVQKDINLSIPNLQFENDKAQVLVTATATEPYNKEIKAIFNIYKSKTEEMIQYNIADAINNDTLKLTINVKNQNGITIHYDGTKITPDATNELVRNNLNNGEITINNINEKEQIVMIFYKKDITQNYSNSNNVAWVTQN